MEDEKIESEYDYALEAKCRSVKKRLDEMSIKEVRIESKELTIRETIQQFYSIGISIDKICQATKKSPKEVKEIIQSEKEDGQEASFQQMKVLEA